MQILKQSTATTIYVGPVLDSAGAAVTTAVLGDFRLVKNGTAATLSGATVTHDANGYYAIALTTGNTDTVGRLTIAVGNTAMSMATHRYTVLLASVFDALLTNATNASGGLVTATAAITGLSGVIATTTNITSAVGIVLAATTHTGATIPTVTTVTNRVTANTDQWGGVAVTGMPMPTYTQPTGFLAATFPTTVASTTNITTVGAVSGSVGSVTGSVGGSVGSISGVTFPANFGVLVINSSGHISRVTLVDTTTTNTDMRGTDGAALATHWTPTRAGYLDGVLIAANYNQRTVSVTGSNHVAADIHELQPAVIQATHFDLGAIDANALAADAASEIATSVWSAATRTLTAFSFSITVDAASIRSAIGMATANLDTQLDAIPTAAEIDTQLTASHGAGSWAVGGTGSGAFTLTVTVNDGTNPLQNATVRMVEGVNAYVGQTNASGVVAFSLDAATYSVSITKDGYSFTPTTKVVSATGSQAYSMTQITPTIPAAAGLSTGTAVCYGTTGLPIAGVVVTIQQVDGKGVAGSAYDGDTFTLTSNAQGVISHNGFVRGAVYSIRRGIRGEVKSFTVPDAASFDLSEIVGRD